MVNYTINEDKLTDSLQNGKYLTGMEVQYLIHNYSIKEEIHDTSHIVEIEKYAIIKWLEQYYQLFWFQTTYEPIENLYPCQRAIKYKYSTEEY